MQLNPNDTVQGLRDAYEAAAAQRKRDEACPSCGHCPTCGRSARPSWPPGYQPWDWQPYLQPDDWTWRPGWFTYTTTDGKTHF